MTSPSRLSDDALEALDRRVRHALETHDASELDVLGYGEISTVLRVGADGGDWACKRLPPFRDRASADRHEALVHEYVERLEAAGVRVIPTEIRRVEANGELVVYVVQPQIDPTTLGPSVFRRVDRATAITRFEQILETMRRAVTPTLAPDGQLSNWAFVGDELLYLDVTTPFLRDEHRALRMDFTPFIVMLPPLMRPLMRRLAPRVVASYHDLRGQTVDFLGNLQKEGLDPLVEPFLETANTKLGFDPPITRTEVRRYYRIDARLYAFMEAARRRERRRVTRRGRVYPLLLPPRIARNL